jgi:subtilisin family serine protease
LRRGLLVIAAAAFALPLAGASANQPASPRGPLVEVVALLDGAPLVGRPHARTQIAREQEAVAARIRALVPEARIRWRYQVVLNGLAVVVPQNSARLLASVRGVREVQASVRYRRTLYQSPKVIGAPQVWGPTLATAGQGIKIAVIDDGVDQTHPFFDASGFAYPTGFPKGQTAYTTPKVIVARAFAPASPAWRNARKPFDAEESEHATHVAGIAAGNRGIYPAASRGPISGIAPGAWIGNYKVLTIPTVSGVGLDGNSPEIAAGIEAAVADGMDVLNLSIGEPETEPSRDLVTQALDAAATAGVVPVVAAGNDYGDFGDGSVGSPGSAARAISVGAVTTSESGRADVVASFSSGGPTPLSLRLKPDVAAPGVSILSSVPTREGTWTQLSGTSMATPHVAGGAALLRARHPSWTVQQLRAALVLTGSAATSEGAQAGATRVGGGRIDLARADQPLLFADPSAVSFGLLRGGAAARATVQLTDAGGGGGAWNVAVDGGADVVTAPASTTVPGTLTTQARVPSAATDGERSGWITLTRGADSRRIPFWVGITVPTLPAPSATLVRTGVYRGNTAGRPSRVSTYRYPTGSAGIATLAGPEQVFRVRLTRRVANFGVAIVSRGRGVTVQPRVVRAGDESAQVGLASLPLNLNPYQAEFGQPVPVSGAVLPAPGAYDIVFDSPRASGAGRFAFRFWIDDHAPPRLRLLTKSVRAGGTVLVAASDAGSGIDARTIHVSVDGSPRAARVAGGRLLVPAGLARGRHRLVAQVSDLQETRNMENVAAILPNTAHLRATFVVS